MTRPAETTAMRSRRFSLRAWFLGMALALSASMGPARALACPNCKEAVAAQPHEAANMARGFNVSVLFMVSMPFALLASGSFFVVRAARKGLLPEL